MSLRAFDPGWTLCAMNDDSGRRGIWYRTTKKELAHKVRVGWITSTIEQVELCSGREGDDHYIIFRVGDTITEDMLYDLENVLLTGSWMINNCYSITCEVCGKSATIGDRLTGSEHNDSATGKCPTCHPRSD